MARTNAIINGTDVGVYTGTGTLTLIAISTSCSISFNTDLRDVSNKGSAGFKAVNVGQKSWTMNCDGLYNPSTANSFIALYTAWIGGTTLTLTWKQGNTQDYYWQGTGLITSLTQNAPLEGNVTWSATFQGSGAIAMTDPLT